jgi:hypothetical protein
LASHQPNSVQTFAICLDFAFLQSQIQTILQELNLPLDHLLLFLSLDTVLYRDAPARQTCETQGTGIVGFHSAADQFVTKSRVGIQVFAYAAWSTPEEARTPDFEDVAFLAHEVVEAVNDPFVAFIGAESPLINLVPPYINAGGGCQINLETGDFIEGLPHSGFPVTLNGFTYHPQNAQLIPWFSREIPSSAFQGAYSYPDTSLLLRPSTPCPDTVAQN